MTNEFEPLVSIIIPVYNGANFMKEAIDSALSQTYKNIEVIVVNDGSNDNGLTEEIAKSYGNRIIYLSKQNGGVSSALNAGISVMNGEYFSWLSHDDKYSPDKIESQIDTLKLLDNRKTVILCGSKKINADSEEIITVKAGKPVWAHFPENKCVSWQIALHSVIRNGSFNGCALLIHRDVFNRCGLFNEELRYSQDLLMWMTIFLNGYSLCRSSGIHVFGRVHAGQLTQTGRALFYKDSLKITSILIEDLCNKSTQEYNFVKDFAIYNAKYNNHDAVEMCVKDGNARLSIIDIIQIRCMEVYGKIRPQIREVFFKVTRRV